MHTKVPIAEETIVGSLYACGFGWLTLSIAFTWMGGRIALVWFLMALVSLPFIFITASLIGLVLKYAEKELKLGTWSLLVIYIFMAIIFTPLVTALMFRSNFMDVSTWPWGVMPEYILIGIMSAIGAWYGAVYKTHNNHFNKGRS